MHHIRRGELLGLKGHSNRTPTKARDIIPKPSRETTRPGLDSTYLPDLVWPTLVRHLSAGVPWTLWLTQILDTVTTLNSWPEGTQQ
jgi:hypothetical protein